MSKHVLDVNNLFISKLKRLPQRCQPGLYLTSRVETLEAQASLAHVTDPTRAPEGMAIGARQITGTGDAQGSAGAVAGRQPVRAAECARPSKDHNPLIAEEEIVESAQSKPM